MIFFLLLVLVFGSVTGCAPASDTRVPERYVSDLERSVDELVQEGLFSAQRGRYDDAEFSFRKALYVMPQNDRVRLNLGVTLERQQQYREAEELYRSLLRRNDSNLRVLGGLARLYVAEGDYENAIGIYKKIATLARSQSEKYAEIRASALRSLATLSYRVGKEEEATCYSEEAVNVLPKNVPERIRHVQMLLSRGLAGRARSALGELGEKVSLLKDPPLLLHQVALVAYEEEKPVETKRICASLLKRSKIPTNVESDCLWLIALIDNYKIVDVRPEDLEDKERVTGFELAYRQFNEGLTGLYHPVRFAEAVIQAQSQANNIGEKSGAVLVGEGDEVLPSLYALSRL